MTIYTRLQIRRGDAAEWIEANPILADGEQALENDTLKPSLVMESQTT